MKLNTLLLTLMLGASISLSLVHAQEIDRFLGLSRETAARFVGVSPNTFDKMMKDSAMPSPRIVWRRKLWNRLELQSAFDALPCDDECDDQSSPWDEDAA